VSDWEKVAEACAEIIKRAVEAAPGSRWNRTGHLLSSIDASGDSVSVPSDRLQRDDLKQLFLEECVKDPTNDPQFNAALDESVTQMLEEELGYD
jgi:hypothetical protein